MNNKTFYVATYRPCFPQGVKTIAYREKDYSRDILPPSLTSLWEVNHVNTKAEAIACVIEKGAGKGVAVKQLI